jgi:hypothetical protein
VSDMEFNEQDYEELMDSFFEAMAKIPTPQGE